MITGWRRTVLGIPSLFSNTDNTGTVSGLALFMIKAGWLPGPPLPHEIINGLGPIAEPQPHRPRVHQASGDTDAPATFAT